MDYGNFADTPYYTASSEISPCDRNETRIHCEELPNVMNQ